MPLLGCIADDFTGATDLANTLVSEGMRVIQVFGVPQEDVELPPSDAIIVALKSRSIPADEAIQLSLGSLEWLKAQGAEHFFFKYCSTFDSTPEGNIGQVSSALMKALDTDTTIACPSFPDNGRTVYQGHLFVFDKLLSESGMQNHPLNPMTDAKVELQRAKIPGPTDFREIYAASLEAVAALKKKYEELEEAKAGKNLALAGLFPRIQGVTSMTTTDDPVGVFGSLLRQA